MQGTDIRHRHISAPHAHHLPHTLSSPADVKLHKCTYVWTWGQAQDHTTHLCKDHMSLCQALNALRLVMHSVINSLELSLQCKAISFTASQALRNMAHSYTSFVSISDKANKFCGPFTLFYRRAPRKVNVSECSFHTLNIMRKPRKSPRLQLRVCANSVCGYTK